jgi:hypothetical protein
MTSKNEARLKMYQSVADFLSKNTTIIETLPNFAALFSGLQSNITGVLQLLKDQSGDRSGIALTKNKEREEIIALTTTLSGKMVAYATILENDILLRKVRMNKARLRRQSDHELPAHCLVLCDEAQSLLSELSSYSVTEEEIKVLRQKCNAYLEIIPKPKESRRDSKVSTNAMIKLLKETDLLLLKMDAIILIISSSNASFYEHYRNSRKTIETGRRGKAILGKVQDAISKTGISRVTVSLIPGNGSSHGKSAAEMTGIRKKTTEKGLFSIPAIETGTYLVTAVKEGYEPQTITAYITDGEVQHLNLELLPK